MRSIVRKVYASEFVWRLHRKSILGDLLIPCYHSVTNNPPNYIKNLYTPIDTKKFEKDIDFLASNYDLISASDLKTSINKGFLPSNKFILTFDDGYRECYDIIYPILKRKGIPAIFFIVSDFVNNKKLSHFNKISLIIDSLNRENAQKIDNKFFETSYNSEIEVKNKIRRMNHNQTSLIDEMGSELKLDFDNILTTRKPYLSSIQIREMASNDFGIGGHSIDHSRFIDLSASEQFNQVKHNLDFLNEITEGKVDFFAFPYSSRGFEPKLYEDFPDIIFFDTFKGHIDSDTKVLQRFIMDTNDPIRIKLVENKLKKLSYRAQFKKRIR